MPSVRGLGDVCRRRCTLVAVLVGGGLGLFAAPALAQEVEWHITMTHANAFGQLGLRDPFARSAKTFARESTGDTYTITVENSGDETSKPEPVVVKDTLPPGMVLYTSESGEGDDVKGGNRWSCTNTTATEGMVPITGRSFQCETDPSDTLEHGQSYPPITAVLSVPATAAPPVTNVTTLTNQATVSGGGASATTTEKEGETTIVPAVPFGIEAFGTFIGKFNTQSGEELEFPNNAKIEQYEKAFEPFSKAGGHPPSLSTSLLFNYTPSMPKAPALGESSFRVEPAGGNAKSVEVEVPPGFVGHTVDVPQCPLSTVQAGNPCPTDTAVGYIAAVLSGPLSGEPGEVTGSGMQLYERPGGPKFENNDGKYRSMVYNVQPPAGSPAAFAFVIDSQLLYVLEVHVQTDGEYAITVGDNAAGGVVPATNVTMCEDGVEGAKATGFHCKQPTAGSKPFFDMPTKCTGAAPIWTAVAKPWADSEFSSSKAVAANAQLRFSKNGILENGILGGEVTATPTKPGSFLEGCNELVFNPEISFGASASSQGGSTEADTPTGLNFELKVPQAKDVQSTPATPSLKNIVTTLPAGITASPSAADGLEACTNAQFGLGTEFGEGSAHTEPAKPASCPPASQIGTVEVRSPLLQGGPTATGPTGSEHTLLCSQGHWSKGRWNASQKELEEEGLSFAYEWLENGSPRKGADQESLVLGAEETNSELPNMTQCQVTASNRFGRSVAVSQPVAPKGNGPFPPANIAYPSGTPAEGKQLTCAAGVWTAPSPLGYKFEWLRDGTPIAGSESATTGVTTSPPYTLTTEDVGKDVQCKITGIGAEIGAGIAIAYSPAVMVSPLPSELPPLPGGSLQGQLFVGQPECSPCTQTDEEQGKLFRVFLQVQDPEAGLVVRQAGFSRVNPENDRMETVFTEQPQQPFELLQLKLKGGPRAPLANPQTCAPAETNADVTPWSTSGLGGPSGKEEIEGTPDAHPSSPFEVGAGEPCTLPFAPSFEAATSGPTATTAGASTDFTVAFGRHDREQDLSGVTVHMPLGLVGKIPAVTLCGEAEALAQQQESEAEGHNHPHCPAASEIGTAVSLAGAGSDPFKEEGHVYLTGPIKKGPFPNAPFGLLVDTPAEAGPFNLGHVVVLSGITIDPNTAAVSVTSEPLPQFRDGVQLRLREVEVKVTKPGFMTNPTNCTEQQVSASLGGLQGANAQVSSKFGVTGCKSLLFHPVFSATTDAHTSKFGGASLHVKITYPLGSNYSNIAKSITDLPVQLPSRLETLQKACRDTVFETNPAACPAGSSVGTAIAHTPLLNQPLSGPAILVSHGGRAFPDLEFLLQGEGVTIVLDGHTNIKKGVTRTTFEAVPDSPVETFELNFPEGSNSILAANENLCAPTREATVKKSFAVRRKGRMVHVMKSVVEHVPEKLVFPTQLIGQNGSVLKQNTVIGVIGCPPTVAVTKTAVSGGSLLVTVKTSAKGTLTISGKGLRTTTRRGLKAGSDQIRVRLTAKGASLLAHHEGTSVKVRLTVGKQVAAQAASVTL
jgi:uncharacterized repeat protein (TIGR01451 family)